MRLQHSFKVIFSLFNARVALLSLLICMMAHQSLRAENWMRVVDQAARLMQSDSTLQESALMLAEITSRYYSNPADTAYRKAATKAFRILAAMQMEHDPDYAKAYKSLSTARMIAQEDGNDYETSCIYGELSRLYSWAADGDTDIAAQSNEFLLNAAKYALKSDNQETMLTAALNMAVVTVNNDSIWSKFEPIANEILNYRFSPHYKKKAELIKGIVRGRDFYLKGDLTSAEEELLKAYDLTGYDTNSNRYIYTVDSFLYDLYLASGDKDKAQTVLRRSLMNAERHNHMDYCLTLYGKMYDFFNIINEKDSSDKYYNKYLDLKFKYQERNGYGNIKEYDLINKIDEINSEVERMSLKVQEGRRQRMIAIFVLIILSIILIFGIYSLLRLKHNHRILYRKNVEMGEREKQGKLIRESLEKEIERLKEEISSVEQPDASPETHSEKEGTPSGNKNEGLRSQEDVTEEDKMEEDTTLVALYTEVLKIMEGRDEIYTPGFSLTDLSVIMRMPERSISKAINHCHNANFHQLLNEYRIRKVTSLMREGNVKHLTIESLGEMVGFKSRSYFVQLFKKMVGVSPKEYLKMSSE